MTAPPPTQRRLLRAGAVLDVGGTGLAFGRRARSPLGREIVDAQAVERALDPCVESRSGAVAFLLVDLIESQLVCIARCAEHTALIDFLCREVWGGTPRGISLPE